MAKRAKKRRRHAKGGQDPAGPALNARITTRWPILRFGLIFIGLMAGFYIVASLPSWHQALYVYLKANASVSNLFLNLLGQETSASDLVIRSDAFAIAVKRGCDAVEPAWLLCAAIIAFPVSWKKKVPGICVGVGIILILNIVRIVSLYLIGRHYPAWFETTHLEIWPAAFIVASVVLMAVWLQWMKRDASPVTA